MSIADVIDAGSRRAPRRRWALAAVFAVTTHAGVLALALASEPTLEFWASDLSTRVHYELSRVYEVPLDPPHAEPPPPPQDAPPAAPTSPRAAPAPAAAVVAPAAAAEALVRDDAPIDFTGATIVTGEARAYAGGTTTRTGTNDTYVPPGTPVARDGAPAISYAKAVDLPDAEWTCPWPREADRAQVDHESVVVRVVVDTDGTPLSVRIVRDPGYGFGAAAAACAMRERYNAARDAAGAPIRAESAALRVTFSR